MNVKEITKIFIIESPAKEDIEKGREEGKALSQILYLANIKNTYIDVTDIKSFEGALEKISKEVKGEIKNYGAITLHFSMHGNKDGLGLTSKEHLDWKTFYSLIKKFNDSLGYIPLPYGKKFAPVSLNFSVCLGFYAVAIKDMGNELPYHALVAPIAPVNWVDSILAFAIYYHNTLHKGCGAKVAVERMNLMNELEDVFKIDLMDGMVLL